MSTTSTSDTQLAADLEELAAADKWEFRSWSAREYTHGLFQYPAMMVPQMQRELLERLREENDGTSVYDPFVGSGTALAEAMMLGLDFVGVDINPLAVLLCKTKAGPFYTEALERASERILDAARSDTSRVIELEWEGWKKWFRSDVAVALSRLRRAIRAEPLLSNRRFLWVALAETVRLTSNSRTSTVKLHIRPQEERENRKIDVVETFDEILEENLERFKDQRDALDEAGLLDRGRYTGKVAIHLHDVSSTVRPADFVGLCSILLTSPPYGDNITTVPYGQHAFLPLQWIDFEDIDPAADDSFLASTHAIDAKSLGAPRTGAIEQVEVLRALSPVLDEILTTLASQPRDRAQRVAAFWRDMNTSIESILPSMEVEGLMGWTVGNRSVGGSEIPMDAILRELLEHRNCTFVTKLDRVIPNCRKRMAPRNSVASTMNREQVLVMRAPSTL